MNPFLIDIISSKGKIYQMTKFTDTDLEEASMLLTEAFFVNEATTKHLKTSFVEFHYCVLGFCRRAISDELGILVKDNGRIISVALFFDHKNNNVNPLTFGIDFTTQIHALNLLDSLKADEYFKNIMEPIYSLAMIGVHPDYTNHGIAKQLLKSAFEQHPAISKVHNFYAECTSPFTVKLLAGFGWKIVNSTDFKTYKDINGINPFEGIEEVAKKMGMSEYNGIHLMSKNSKLSVKE